MWSTDTYEPCISGVMRSYKHLFKGENPNPNYEVATAFEAALQTGEWSDS